jgi:hypothetical protein
MSFKPAAGYGDMFSYTTAQARTDGFEVKNLSIPILRQAFSQLVFTRLLNQSRNAFGVGKGGTFTIPIALDWGAPTSVTPLTSGTAIGIGSQKLTSVSMAMYEYGTGVGYEGFTDWVTNLDIRNELVTTLGNHIGRMINWLDYDIISKTMWSIEVPATGSYRFIGSNRAGGTMQATYGELGPGGLAMAYDTFKKSLVMPATDRGLYLAVGNAESFRNLKQGSVFQNLSLYTDQRGLRYQILGEFMNFLFVETEELTSKGSIFLSGANVGGYGFGLNPRPFFYPDFGQDAGRLDVWKTLFYRGQGTIYRDIGTACIMVRANTAAFSYGNLG